MTRRHTPILSLVATTLALTLAPAAQAAVVNATSYSMFNGDGQAHGGSFNYWDHAYNGSGSTSTDHAALTGGTGGLAAFNDLGSGTFYGSTTIKR